MRALANACVLGLLGLSGCNGASADERIELQVADLPLASSAEGGFETAPFDQGPWLRYPGRATLVVHHALGRAPRQILVYLSFHPTPIPAGGGAGLAVGDLARIVAADAESVTIRNDTEGDYYVRLVLE